MMDRQISYNWLPEEARAIAVDQYVEGFLNFRVLTAIALLFYLPLIVQAYWANPEFYMHPLFLVILLGPVAIYALEYWRYLKNASSPEGKWGVVGAPVTFSWDDKGFEVSCDGNGFRLDWSNFQRSVETERFFKLYGEGRQEPMYVFKRPMSDAQREDFGRCALVIGSIHPAFT